MIYVKTSRQILAESFIQLVESRQKGKITVTDIKNNCGHSRRTFYNYFDNKRAITAWIFAHEDEIFGQEPWYCSQDYSKAVLEQLQLIKKHHLFYANILATAEGKELFCAEAERRLDIWLRNRSVSARKKEFVIRFLSYGYTNIVAWWVQSGMKESPNILIKYLREFMANDFLKALTKPPRGLSDHPHKEAMKWAMPGV